MPKERTTVPEVNLMPGEDLEGKPGGVFLKWALTWGKRIVVGTELIVILAFLSRFWLDTEVANLSEKINQKKAIIQGESKFEKDFRSFSDRVAHAKAINDLVSPLAAYDQTLAMLPVGIAISSFSLNSRTVNFSGSANETTLSKLIANLRSSPHFGDLTVQKISQTESDPNIDFTLQVAYLSSPSGTKTAP